MYYVTLESVKCTGIEINNCINRSDFCRHCDVVFVVLKEFFRFIFMQAGFLKRHK